MHKTKLRLILGIMSYKEPPGFILTLVLVDARQIVDFCPSVVNSLTMLYFIVPLRSRAASKDWNKVSRLCERTLRSICQQTSSQFRVFLVCRDRPEMDFAHPNLRIIQEDFPIPEPEKKPQRVDKYKKLRRALIAVREEGGGHVMAVDADDLVHRSLAALVEANPNSDGWFFPHGYSYDEGGQWLEKHFDFYLRCGTSNIIRIGCEDLPADTDSPTEKYFFLCNGHNVIADFMARSGKPLKALSFPGAVYVKDTGENLSGPPLKGSGVRAHVSRLSRLRLLTPRHRAIFGIRPLGV
jgi:hypothetical protein